MTEAWPSGVPHEPEGGGQKVAPFRAPMATDMDDGNRRYRRSGTKNIATLTLSIPMTNSEFGTFKSWVRDALVDGTLPFTMSIWTGSDYETRTCQFREPYQDDPGSGIDNHKVSLNLDVEDY